jgi:hypothetical protein
LAVVKHTETIAALAIGQNAPTRPTPFVQRGLGGAGPLDPGINREVLHLQVGGVADDDTFPR